MEGEEEEELLDLRWLDGGDGVEVEEDVFSPCDTAKAETNICIQCLHKNSLCMIKHF